MRVKSESRRPKMSGCSGDADDQEKGTGFKGTVILTKKRNRMLYTCFQSRIVVIVMVVVMLMTFVT